MSLSCNCDFDFDREDVAWYWTGRSDFYPVSVSGQRKRCISCGAFIKPLTDTMEFYRYRVSRNDIEERIYGEEVPLASDFMCEECAGLYLALEELGYGCFDISQPMEDYIAEYNEADK